MNLQKALTSTVSSSAQTFHIDLQKTDFSSDEYRDLITQMKKMCNMFIKIHMDSIETFSIRNQALLSRSRNRTDK